MLEHGYKTCAVCTQASETTLYKHTRMMVVATWAPHNLETVDFQSGKNCIMQSSLLAT